MTVFGDESDKKRPLRLPIAGGTYYGLHPERYDYWRVGYGAAEGFALGFWIERVGEFHGKPNYTTGDFHWTHSTQVFCHLVGEAVFEFGNRSMRVSAGDMMVIPPYQPFNYRGRGIQYDWLAIAGEWPRVLGDGSKVHYLSLPPDQEIRTKFAEIREVLIFQQYGYPIKAIGIFYELVARLETLRHGSAGGQSAYPETVRNAMIYLAENYSDPYDAAQTAAAVNISPSRLRALFKQWLGQSPRQYHTRYRLEQASRLLREQHLSVSAVAHEVGYDDARYFSRVFKQLFGVSPSQFRRDG